MVILQKAFYFQNKVKRRTFKLIFQKLSIFKKKTLKIPALKKKKINKDQISNNIQKIPLLQINNSNKDKIK